MDSYIGKMLDNRYEILERIGTGGMAVVYKAKCHRLNRMVAVKILKADLAQDADFRRRFNAEAQAVAQLSHPNIVSVYDVPRGGDTEYIVMELIDGITLKQYMEKRGQLNWRESLHFITQIMRGLSHAHSRGIIHRDIKPQNVMVLRDGSVKVADFGIACLENSAQTLTQEALGSVHYISPEQARGDRTDARSDIYSAGVVFYEMLTGRLPFEGDSAVSVAIQHLSSIPLAPREINAEIPEQLELICMKAMAPDLERRYPSADAMIADLETFRKNPDVSMDFEMADLRPEEEDEPTRLLRTGAYVSAAGQSHRQSAREPAHERDRHRDEYYDEPASQGDGKRTAVIVGITAVVAVVLVFFLFRSIFSSFNDTAEEFTVPTLLGLTEAEAQRVDGIEGVFTIVVQGSEASDTYEVGQICRQDPEGNKLVKGENLVINVWTSSGEDSAVMPDITLEHTVVSATRTVLKSLIEQYELTIDASEDLEQNSDEVAAGYILSTDPVAGEPLRKGDTIRIVVSKGPETVPVLPFVGMQIDLVTSQLEALSLKQGKVEEVDSDQPAGTVLEQDPAANTQVPKNSPVNFKVSKGPVDGPASGQGSDILFVALPGDQESGYIEVYLDGTLAYESQLDYASVNWSFSREFTGTGTAEARVYIDSVFYTSAVLEFSHAG